MQGSEVQVGLRFGLPVAAAVEVPDVGSNLGRQCLAGWSRAQLSPSGARQVGRIGSPGRVTLRQRPSQGRSPQRHLGVGRVVSAVRESGTA